MAKPLISFAAALALAAPSLAQETAPSPNQIVEAAAPGEWVPIPAEDLLVMDLAPNSEGNPRRVVIQLMPAPFSQGWVGNIRLLARSHWYDGISVNRVQDNYVVQWGDPNYDNPEADGETKPLPEGLKVMGEDEYVVDAEILGEASDTEFDSGDSVAKTAGVNSPAIADALRNMEAAFADLSKSEEEHDKAVSAFLMTAGLAPNGMPSPREELAMISIKSTATPSAPEGWHQRDSFAQWVEIWKGWPLANYERGKWLDSNDKVVPAPNVPRHEAYGMGLYHEVEESKFWPVHCYGMVGVGRNLSPDTGSGAELYTVIGHAPRHLDRNIALVGRVIEGMEHLSSLPRGKGELGFYADFERDKRTPILTVRMASDLAASDRPQFQYLSTESETFAKYAEARANRRDAFFIHPAGGADICNIPVPVRRVLGE